MYKPVRVRERLLLVDVTVVEKRKKSASQLGLDGSR